MSYSREYIIRSYIFSKYIWLMLLFDLTYFEVLHGNPGRRPDMKSILTILITIDFKKTQWGCLEIADSTGKKSSHLKKNRLEIGTRPDWTRLEVPQAIANPLTNVAHSPEGCPPQKRTSTLKGGKATATYAILGIYWYVYVHTLCTYIRVMLGGNVDGNARNQVCSFCHVFLTRIGDRIWPRIPAIAASDSQMIWGVRGHPVRFYREDESTDKNFEYEM